MSFLLCVYTFDQTHSFHLRSHCYNDDPFVDSTMRISPTTDAMDVMHGYIVESTDATIDTICVQATIVLLLDFFPSM